MHRRNFLRSALTAGTALAASATVIEPHSLVAREPILRRGGPRFQLGLAAYSLRQYFSFMKGKPKKPLTDGPAIDMVGFMDYCVDQGVDAAELTSYFFRADADDDYFRDLKRQAFLRGLAISGTAIGNNFTVGRGERLDKQIQDALDWIDRAAVLGAPHIRFFAGTGKELAEDPGRIAEAVEAMQQCAARAGEHGIFLGIENHGNLTSDQMLELMQRIESPWVGVNLDSGNFFSDDPYRDLERVAPYTVNVQVKVSMQSADRKRYPADLDRVAKILADSGYQGYVNLEYEDDEPYANIPAALDRLRNALEKAV
ncbi:MAG: sugar phosphate isomerase/epimerase family protein [Planctomycetota bacterium]